MRRAELERLFARALRDLDLDARVSRAAGAWLAAAPRLGARIVAIGKAAPAMAAGAMARAGDGIERCLVVAPDGTDVSVLLRVAARAGIDDRVVVMRAAHPLPDARSVRAGEACLKAVASTEPRKVLVLISGGASALACAPSPGVTLRVTRAITRAMLHGGASVQELNVVRKHLSRLKGGGLARAAGSNVVLTLIASDVIGGSASDVGSGPSVPDASTASEARRLLRRFAPSFVDMPLAPTLAASRANVARYPAKTIASPEQLALAFARRLREHEPERRVVVLPASQASAEALAADYVARARRAKAPWALVRAAEPAVTVSVRAGAAADRGSEGAGGRGGRSTHLAALVGRELEALPGVTFAAFASDGVDGASGTGGAVVTPRFAAAVAKRLGAGALARALARFDTGPIHHAAGTARPLRPSGHNLADLHVLLVD